MKKGMKLRACERCSGDLLLNVEDEEYVCLQCDRSQPLHPSVIVRKAPVLLVPELAKSEAA